MHDLESSVRLFGWLQFVFYALPLTLGVVTTAVLWKSLAAPRTYFLVSTGLLYLLCMAVATFHVQPPQDTLYAILASAPPTRSASSGTSALSAPTPNAESLRRMLELKRSLPHLRGQLGVLLALSLPTLLLAWLEFRHKPKSPRAA